MSYKLEGHDILYNLYEMDCLIASRRTCNTLSTFLRFAFSPINPMRNICPAVGPRPPEISIAYLQKDNANYANVLGAIDV